MPQRVRMVPTEGRRVLFPAGSARAGRPLPAGGAVVTLDAYWSARLREGGGEIIEDKPAAKPAPAPAAEE